jgi:hypothetical protein
MRKWIGAVAALAVLALPGMIGTASAANLIEVGVGIDAPTADFADTYNGSIAATGSFLFGLTPHLSAGVTGGIHTHSFDDEGFLEAGSFIDGTTVSGGDVSIFQAAAELRAGTGAADLATIFGFGGLGMYYISADDVTVTVPGFPATELAFDSEAKLGWYFGAGAGIPITPVVRLGAKAQFNSFTLDDLTEDFGPIDETRSYFTFYLIGSMEI